MKKPLLILTAFALFCESIYPCTTFVLKTKTGSFFGRNLDWTSDLGMLLINPKNREKKSLVFPPEKPVEWISKYGSLTFNQFGKEFPFGGINEKGLVIEIMLAPAEYPAPDNRPVVNELQWIQYQLDNCATTAEVIATDSKIRIGQTYENLHYLVCDASGNVAVIEFIEGKMKTYTGKKLPMEVLENQTYQQSLQDHQNQETCRFNTAVDLVKNYDGSAPVSYSFNILEQVALSAEWSVVYDINQQQVHFKTKSNTEVRLVDLHDLDFTCSNQTQAYNLEGNEKGKISKKFIPLSSTANKKLVQQALENNAVVLEEEQSNLLFGYFEEGACR
jgi:penicillin V acylase-like amidase (Ntn superfamily)